jgi:hypothetical protein
MCNDCMHLAIAGGTAATAWQCERHSDQNCILLGSRALQQQVRVAAIKSGK